LLSRACRASRAAVVASGLLWAGKLPEQWEGTLFSPSCKTKFRLGHFFKSVSLLKWARRSGGAWVKSPSACERAAMSGSLDVMQYVVGHGCVPDANTCGWAAIGGHLEVLRWLKDHECPWDETTCEYAARFGHTHVLRWARANNCPWNSRICGAAAADGRLETLTWAVENGCDFNEETSEMAARGGNLGIVQYLHSKGCPWGKGVTDTAYGYGHDAFLLWVRAHGCPDPEEALFNSDYEETIDDYRTHLMELGVPAAELEHLKIIWETHNSDPTNQ